MSIPADKLKYGKQYLPPIYVKFVHRSVVHEILRKRHLLRNAQNEKYGIKYGQKYGIRENLTLCRKILLERCEKELTSYRYGWVKNGNILVRKKLELQGDQNHRAQVARTSRYPKQS